MPYKIIVKPIAEQEIRAALEWYREQNQSLPSKLYKELQERIKELQHFPRHYQKRYKEIRVLFIHKFPYGIYYTVEGKTIYIHAFLHTKQNPDQIETRI